MKLSETRNISEILKKIGIHEDPKNMAPEDIEKLAKNPEIRNALFDAFGGTRTVTSVMCRKVCNYTATPFMKFSIVKAAVSST